MVASWKSRSNLRESATYTPRPPAIAPAPKYRTRSSICASDLVVHNAVDVEVQSPLRHESTVSVLTLEETIVDVEVNKVVAVTLYPTGDSASRSVGEPEHLVDLVEEDVPTSLKNIVGVLLLALQVKRRQVLVSRPVVVGLIEDDAIRRGVTILENRLCRLAVHHELLSGNRDSLEDSVLTELSLDLLLVRLEGLVNSGVGGSQRGVPLEHDAVTSSQSSDRSSAQNQRRSVQLTELGRHSSIQDNLVVCGILISELTLFLGLMDLDEKRSLLRHSLFKLEGGLGSENGGPDEASGASNSQDCRSVLAEHQRSPTDDTGCEGEIHLILPAFLSRR
nr:MAG TPA: hypothetical protein [Caudoviricetes sp.]